MNERASERWRKKQGNEWRKKQKADDKAPARVLTLLRLIHVYFNIFPTHASTDITSSCLASHIHILPWYSEMHELRDLVRSLGRRPSVNGTEMRKTQMQIEARSAPRGWYITLCNLVFVVLHLYWMTCSCTVAFLSDDEWYGSVMRTTCGLSVRYLILSLIPLHPYLCRS